MKLFQDENTPVESLIQMNKVLGLIIDSGFDGVYIADHLGRGLKINEAYTRLTGVCASKLIGRTMTEVVNEGIVSESVTLKVLKYKKPMTIMQRINNKEFLVTGSPVFNDRQQITHVVTNIRDLSELNELKRELSESKKYTEKILNEFKSREEVKHLLYGVIAHSKETIDVITIIKKVCKVDSTVMLLGETGVGKEVFANMIHMNSHRVKQPYIKVNCAAIPGPLLESELFGYEKGAFTGADRNGKIGLFEKANGGTIFLDEIGELSLELQVKLLRVLQEFELRRIGGTEPIKVDVRVISATNQDLEQLVKEGRFRADLFYRLNIVPINIPPLRKRIADIAPLAYYFINKVNETYQFSKRFHPEVIYAMEQYEWPGNIREMENLIERVAVTTDHDELTLADFPVEMFTDIEKKTYRGDTTTEIDLKSAVQDLEKRLIKAAMQKHKTTRRAAQSLQISQSTLVKKMQKLRISIE